MIDADDIVSFPPPDERCPHITVVCDHLTALDLARIEAQLLAYGTAGGNMIIGSVKQDSIYALLREFEGVDYEFVAPPRPYEMLPTVKPEPQPHGWYRQFEKRRRRSR